MLRSYIIYLEIELIGKSKNLKKIIITNILKITVMI